MVLNSVTPRHGTQEDLNAGYFVMPDGRCFDVGGSEAHSRWVRDFGPMFVSALDVNAPDDDDGNGSLVNQFLTETGAVRVRHLFSTQFVNSFTGKTEDTPKALRRRDVIFTVPNLDDATLDLCQSHFQATYPRRLWREIHVGITFHVCWTDGKFIFTHGGHALWRKEINKLFTESAQRTRCPL